MKDTVSNFTEETKPDSSVCTCVCCAYVYMHTGCTQATGFQFSTNLQKKTCFIICFYFYLLRHQAGRMMTSTMSAITYNQEQECFDKIHWSKLIFEAQNTTAAARKTCLLFYFIQLFYVKKRGRKLFFYLLHATFSTNSPESKLLWILQLFCCLGFAARSLYCSLVIRQLDMLSHTRTCICYAAVKFVSILRTWITDDQCEMYFAILACVSQCSFAIHCEKRHFSSVTLCQKIIRKQYLGKCE